MKVTSSLALLCVLAYSNSVKAMEEDFRESPKGPLTTLSFFESSDKVASALKDSYINNLDLYNYRGKFDYLEGISHLTVTQKYNLSPDDVSYILSSPKLISLTLWNTNTSDDQFKEFSEKSHLEKLKIVNAHPWFTSKSIEEIVRSPSLKKLTLFEPPVELLSAIPQTFTGKVTIEGMWEATNKQPYIEATKHIQNVTFKEIELD